MVTGEDIPERPQSVRGPRTLDLRNPFWLALALFLWS